MVLKVCSGFMKRYLYLSFNIFSYRFSLSVKVVESFPPNLKRIVRNTIGQSVQDFTKVFLGGILRQKMLDFAADNYKNESFWVIFFCCLDCRNCS